VTERRGKKRGGKDVDGADWEQEGKQGRVPQNLAAIREEDEITMGTPSWLARKVWPYEHIRENRRMLEAIGECKEGEPSLRSSLTGKGRPKGGKTSARGGQGLAKARR